MGKDAGQGQGPHAGPGGRLQATAGGLVRDVGLALRTFRRAPAYALVVVLTLGLGIGATTAIFSIIHGVVLKPLENEEGDRLMVLQHHQPGAGQTDMAWSVLDLEAYRDGLGGVEAVVEAHQMSFNLIGNGEPEEVLTGVVDHRFFEVMGVDPILGRGFTEEEDRTGGDAVMVLSYPYWQSRFGGDPAVLGRTFVMNDRVHTVIGVLPDVPQYPRANDIYVPTSQCPIRSAADFREDRNARMMQAFVRLPPGGDVESLRREAGLLAGRLAAEFPGSYAAERGYTAGATPLKDELVSDSGTTLLLLLATAGLVLLVACANVANLALARLSRREQEFAVRRALGAGEGAVARQLLVESTVLALAGALLGITVAWGGLELLVSYAGRFTPRAAEATLSTPVLVFAVATALLTGIVSGSAPVLAGRRSAATTLRESSGATRTRRILMLQNGLVVAQVALAFVLLTGAGLMVRSFLLLQDVDAGFATENVVTMRVAFPVGGPYGDPRLQEQFWEAVQGRVRELPGVESVAVANLAPLSGGTGTVAFHVEGGGRRGDGEPSRAQSRTVSREYFATAGIPLLAGAGFPPGLRSTDERVAIVNRTFARTHFGEDSPVGARLIPCSAQGRCDPDRAVRVVGMVGDVRQAGLEVEPAAEVYVSGRQQGSWGNRILVRTRMDPLGVARSVVAAVHVEDPALPVVDIRTLASLRSESLAPRRLTTFLLGGFSGLALLVTLAGIAGVTAFSVAQRQREIGVRMALGAEGGEVLSLILRDALVLVGAGLALGIGLSLLIGGVMESLIWGIAPTDAATWILVSVLLVAVTLLACWVPARKATRINPLVAFRGGVAVLALAGMGGVPLQAQQEDGSRSARQGSAERMIPSPDLVQGFGPALSPDGGTLLYVARRRPETILLSLRNGDGWHAPVTAPFSGRWPDQEPFISPDGRTVYFASRRPVEEGGPENPEYDLWKVERLDDGTFGTPRRLGPEVNTDGYENYPSVTADGTLFFSRRTPDAGTDLFQAHPDGDGFHPATPLEGLNSWGSDADPWIDRDGRRLIFSSVRGDGAGQGDLYVSYLCREGWTTPWNLGPRVNTEAYEYTPVLSPDGAWLLFSRDRWGVWRIPAGAVEIESPCPADPSGGSAQGLPPGS